MGLHSHECEKKQEARRRDDANYLAEYVRKIYMTRSADFDEHAGGMLQQLHVYLRDDELSTSIHVKMPENGNVREADFAVDTYSDDDSWHRYEFSIGRGMIWHAWQEGDSYEGGWIDDDQAHVLAMCEVLEVLDASDVEPPVTESCEEVEFWDIVLNICYDDMELGVRHAMWGYIDAQLPTKAFSEFVTRTQEARAVVEMALGVHASISCFSARGATKYELNRLYWGRELDRKFDKPKIL